MVALAAWRRWPQAARPLPIARPSPPRRSSTRRVEAAGGMAGVRTFAKGDREQAGYSPRNPTRRRNRRSARTGRCPRLFLGSGRIPLSQIADGPDTATPGLRQGGGRDALQRDTTAVVASDPYSVIDEAVSCSDCRAEWCSLP